MTQEVLKDIQTEEKAEETFAERAKIIQNLCSTSFSQSCSCHQDQQREELCSPSSTKAVS